MKFASSKLSASKANPVPILPKVTQIFYILVTLTIFLGRSSFGQTI
jgi:hypothetical protein